MALSKSLPTPKTHELLRVVTRLAVGAPEGALFDTAAPIAPDPFVPEGSTPAKAITVIEETTAWDRAAVIDALVRPVFANARQISDVPLCPLARTTRVQVKFPPVTPFTTVFEPDSQSVEMKANKSSLPEDVEN
jgi:hypothetical protein